MPGDAARGTPAPVRAEGLPREKGAIYLEDFFGQPYRLRVLTDAPIYFNIDQARFLGTLRRGEAGGTPGRVGHAGRSARARAGQPGAGRRLGARALPTPLDAAFVDGLRRSTERRRQVQALVAGNEIALGMTPEEVAASLGQPGKRNPPTPTRRASRKRGTTSVTSRCPGRSRAWMRYGRACDKRRLRARAGGKFCRHVFRRSVSAIDQTGSEPQRQRGDGDENGPATSEVCFGQRELIYDIRAALGL